GAGGAPTASAVMGDLVTVARNRHRGTNGPALTPYTNRGVAPIGDAVTRYYLALPVHDAPGVLARIASVFAKHGVSISAVRQTESPDQPGTALLGIMTHAARDAEVQDTVAELKTDSRAVTGRIRHMRVEGA
ncbi:MAG: ACT domain-containing protein, partial [Propionibacteriaceae bacterium]|nr:ACT domain-containing protein [Propionibacteriaceae bacterium]